MKHQKDLPTPAEASAELESMTPGAYIELMSYVQQMEISLPEAPASINFKVKMPTGEDAMLTMRDWDENNLIERFDLFVSIMREKGAAPIERDKRPENLTQKEVRITSEVNADVINGADVEVFEVSSLTYLFTQNGNPYLNVRGGVWQKYGWRAYPEIVPPEFDLNTWTTREEITAVPLSMKYAYVNKGLKKIVAFATE
jgi:hypothetical protein